MFNRQVTFKVLDEKTDKEREEFGLWIDNVIATNAKNGFMEHCALVELGDKLIRLPFGKITLLSTNG